MALLVVFAWLSAFGLRLDANSSSHASQSNPSALPGNAEQVARFHAAIEATLYAGLISFLSLPLLSLGRLINPLSISLIWCVAVALPWLVGRRATWAGLTRLRTVARDHVSSLKSDALSVVRGEQAGTSMANLAIAAGIASLATMTFFAGLLYPPSTWDSLAHHMPRVFQILQNGTVEFFPTFYPTMNTTYPFQAYALVHIRALNSVLLPESLADIGMNTLQWFALVITALGVYWIAITLGASRLGARVAQLAAWSTTSAALQATAEMYDLVVGMWLVLAIYASLVIADGAPDSRRRWVATLGVVVGLGVVTKITFALVFLPFAVILVVRVLKRFGLQSLAAMTALALTIAIVISLPWFGMNALAQNGDALLVSTAGNKHVLAPDRSFGALWANSWRAIGSELGTPSPQLNAIITTTLITPVAEAFGHDIDNPANKEMATQRYELNTLVTDPEVSGSPINVLILTVCIPLVVAGGLKRDGRYRLSAAYLVAGVVGFVLTAALVTWQPMIVRTLVPSLLILAPAVGLVVSRAAQLSSRQRHGVNMWISFSLAAMVGWTAICIGLGFIQPLVPQNLLSPSFGHVEASGWWNTPYADRPIALYYQWVAPQCAAAEKAIATAATIPQPPAGNGETVHPPVALIGGNAALLQPVYPVMKSLSEAGYVVQFDTTYNPKALFKETERLNAAVRPSGDPAIVISFDALPSHGSAQVGSSTVALGARYKCASIVEISADEKVSVWVLKSAAAKVPSKIRDARP